MGEEIAFEMAEFPTFKGGRTFETHIIR